MIVPRWIEPKPRETLNSYAKRFAALVDPGCNCYVGGVSFGGLVALEMATHLNAQGCFLISSVRSNEEFPWWVQAFRPLAMLGSERLGRLAGWVSGSSAPTLPSRTIQRLNRLASPRSAFIRWASWAALEWTPSSVTRDVRVFQIHGSADRGLPVQNTRPDVVVPGGGHLLPMTHPDFVNDFIRRRIGA